MITTGREEGHVLNIVEVHETRSIASVFYDVEEAKAWLKGPG
jgi:hypothetical protein